MTLTRPAYEVTVENIDTGWTDTVAAGDTADPDAGVWLADGLELSWRFESPPPAQLEPEVAKFAILADGYANLPAFDLGDIVRVLLERPTAGDPIVYMDFVGRVTDTDLVTVAETGRVRMNVIAVDPTSEVANTRHGGFDDDDSTSYPVSAQGDIEFTYNVAVVSYASCTSYVLPALYFGNSSHLQHEAEKTFYTATREVLAGGLQSDTSGAFPWAKYPVQRYAKDPLGGTWIPYPGFSGSPTLPWILYLAHWVTTLSADLPALFEYGYGDTGDDVTAIPVAGTVDPDASVTVIDASVLADAAQWAKDRRAAPNSIGVQGRDFTTGETTPARYADDPASIERYGRIERPVIDSGIPESYRYWLAVRYLGLTSSNANEIWLSNGFTIKTHVMDDDELDAYAPLFWTAREPIPGDMGRRIVVRNISDPVDPTGDLLVTNLAGATFKCQDGRLEIQPELTPAVLTYETGKTAGPTFDAFEASAFGGATYHDQGGTTDYIATGVSYDRAKFTSL